MKKLMTVFLAVLLLMGIVPMGVLAEEELQTIRILGPVGQYMTFEEVKTTKTWARLEEMFAAKGIKLEVTAVERDQYATVLQAQLASGNVPDFFSANSLSDADRINLIESGRIMCIDDVLRYSDGTALEALSEDGAYYICREKDSYSDGKLYYFGNVSMLAGVEHPTFGLNTVTGTQYGMKIRKDWLDKLGLEMPTTLDEFLNVLVAFRENDANGNGIADERMVIQLNTCNSTWGTYFDNGLANWFGLANYVFQLDRTEWKAQVPFLQEGFLPYIDFIKKCVDAQVIYLSDNAGKSDNVLISLLSENVAGAYQYAASSDRYIDENQVYVTMPNITAVEGITPTITGSRGYKAWNYWGLSSQCDPEAVAKFLDVVLSVDYSIWYGYGGIEGESYEVVDGVYNNVTELDKEKYMETGLTTGLNCVYSGFLPQPSLNAYYSTYKGEPIVWGTYEDFLASEYFAEVVVPSWREQDVQSIYTWVDNVLAADVMYNMNGDLSMIMPMSTAEEAEIIGFYEAEVYTYMDEVFANLINGNWSTENYDEYVAQMRAIGLDALLEVYQGKYDRLQH